MVSRIEAAPDPPTLLRRVVERAIGAGERRLAVSETSKRLIVVTDRTLLVGTIGWLMGNHLHLYRIDRIDVLSRTVDAKGVSMLHMKFGARDEMLMRQGDPQFDGIADALAEAMGTRPA